MGSLLWVQISPKFYCNCFAVCTIVKYITVIYRESTVHSLMQWNFHSFGNPLSWCWFYVGKLEITFAVSIVSGGWDGTRSQNHSVWKEGNALFIVHRPCHDCRWSGDVMSQGINSHGTVRSRYIAVIFLWRSHERHLLARPWGRDMGCRSWMQRLAEFVSL